MCQHVLVHTEHSSQTHWRGDDRSTYRLAEEKARQQMLVGVNKYRKNQSSNLPWSRVWLQVSSPRVWLGILQVRHARLFVMLSCGITTRLHRCYRLRLRLPFFTSRCFFTNVCILRLPPTPSRSTSPVSVISIEIRTIHLLNLPANNHQVEIHNRVRNHRMDRSIIGR